MANPKAARTALGKSSDVRELPKRPPHLIDSRMEPADYRRKVFRIKPETGVKLEDVLSPLYWAHVAPKISVGDLIEVVPEDRAWFAELFVVSTARTSVNVRLLRHVPLQDDDLTGDATPIDLVGYSIEWAGSEKWRAVRISDHSVIVAGFESKDALIAELRAQLKG